MTLSRHLVGHARTFGLSFPSWTEKLALASDFFNSGRFCALGGIYQHSDRLAPTAQRDLVRSQVSENRMNIRDRIATVSSRVKMNLLQRAEATPAMDEAVAALENQFGVRFEALAVFSQAMLRKLHSDASGESLYSGIRIASECDPRIIELTNNLTELANQETLNLAGRQRYLDTLLQIYRRLDLDAASIADRSDTLVVGIEREGRILAERIGCLLPGRGLRPQAKRVHFDGGLVVGIGGLGRGADLGTYDHCIVIDGAIASGATQLTLLEHLQDRAARFSIFSAHATVEGLRSIGCYAEDAGIDLQVTVGHATPGLNEHFYAVLSSDPSRLVVGDLGDTIDPLA
jgi:hypothetical protein